MLERKIVYDMEVIRMKKTMSISVMIALVAVMACFKDSGGLDAEEENALMTAVVEGNWQEVEMVCTSWKLKQPKNFVATWLLRWTYAEQNKMKMESILSNELDLFDKKRKKDAVTFAKRMVKAHGESAVAWTLLSEVQGRVEMNKEALNSTDRALSVDDLYDSAWANKGVVLGKNMGRYAEAVECFDKAIQINPDNTIAWNNRGTALVQMDRLEEALKCYDEAIKINPNNAMAWNNKSLALGRMSTLEEAIKSVDKAIRINPNFFMAWSSKGWVLGQIGRLEESVDCYDKAIQINSNDAEVWYNKGWALEEMENHEEAIKCYDKAIRINPNHAKAWYNKSWALGQMGRLEESLKCYDKAIRINPKLSSKE
jgi:tetratricopeptide (TPR) repeat protein